MRVSEVGQFSDAWVWVRGLSASETLGWAVSLGIRSSASGSKCEGAEKREYGTGAKVIRAVFYVPWESPSTRLVARVCCRGLHHR